MSENRKKPNEKAMLVFKDYNIEKVEKKFPIASCSFELFPCFMRGILGEDK